MKMEQEVQQRNHDGLSSDILNGECDVQVTVHHDKFIQRNKLDALISQIYFWNRTPHVSNRFSVHHQESSTI